MRRQDFEANLAKTVGDLRLQTGLETGGPTGTCYQVVLGALTGAAMNFNRPPASPEEIRALEQEAGLVRAGVFSSGVLTLDALKTLLQQRKVSFHAVMAEGRIQTGLRQPAVASHSVAIVADETLRPFGVVDSLKRGGVERVSGDSPADDVMDAALYAQGRFLPYNPTLYLALDEAGIETLRSPGRLVQVSDRVAVSMMAPPQA